MVSGQSAPATAAVWDGINAKKPNILTDDELSYLYIYLTK